MANNINSVEQEKQKSISLFPDLVSIAYLALTIMVIVYSDSTNALIGLILYAMGIVSTDTVLFYALHIKRLSCIQIGLVISASVVIITVTLWGMNCHISKSICIAIICALGYIDTMYSTYLVHLSNAESIDLTKAQNQQDNNQNI